MKAVLISIQPKWCELIANGKKLVEVRKTKPKIDVPFKCYIYCTMPKNKHDNLVLTPFGYDVGSEGVYYNYTGNSNGKVIGEFVCDKIYDITPHFDTPTFPNQYICGWDYGKEFDCLSFEELTSYLNGKKGYGWHISDLVIYHRPIELCDFSKPCTHNGSCDTCKHSDKGFCTLDKSIRPPQSWCYANSRLDG